MRRILFAASAAACVMLVPAGMAHAEECVLEAPAPTVPDGATATAEQVEATKQSILAFQKALAPYRECLNGIMDNTELEKEVRQAALDKFNASVDEESALVESWQKMMSAYNAR